MAVNHVVAVLYWYRTTSLYVGLRCQFIRIRYIDTTGHIWVEGLVAESGKRYACAPQCCLHSQFTLVSVLPFQVGVVLGCGGLCIVGIEGPAVGGGAWCEGQFVAIGGGWIQDGKGGLLDRLSPTAEDRQVADSLPPVLPEDVLGIDARRHVCHGAVFRTLYHGDVRAESCPQMQGGASAHGHGELVFQKECHVVHEGQFVVAVLPPCGCHAHVFVIEASSQVSATGKFRSQQDGVHCLAPTPCPVGLCLHGIRQGLGVGKGAHIPVTRRAKDDVGIGILLVEFTYVISCLGGMDVWLCRGRTLVGVRLVHLVAIRHGGLQGEVRYPRLVQKPVEFHVATEHVVARLCVCILELVGVGLRVVSAYVSSQGCGKAERMPQSVLEGVGVGQVHVVAHVCRMWRCKIAYRTCMLGIGVKRTSLSSKVETLAKGNGLGLRLHHQFHHEGSASLAGVYLHHTVGQVAVLH